MLVLVLVVILVCRSAAGGARGSSDAETRQCSLYMKEFDQFVSRAADMYLSPFICNNFIIHR